MAVYVDDLMAWGWILRGRRVQSCHMIADTFEELHAMATMIGMKRSWYQPRSFPHYDLVASRRADAVVRGAIELPIRVFCHVKWALNALPEYQDVPGVRRADLSVRALVQAHLDTIL